MGLRINAVFLIALKQRSGFCPPVCQHRCQTVMIASMRKKRIFVCDTDLCGAVVRFSSERQGTVCNRADCEFAGSFTCDDWQDLPARFRWAAWDERLINATWHCHHTCGAPTTLNDAQKQARAARTQTYQKGKTQDLGKGSTSASSSTAGSRKGQGGKGAKSGKRKRPPGEQPQDLRKGMKKGGSKDQAYPMSRRRTY